MLKYFFSITVFLFVGFFFFRHKMSGHRECICNEKCTDKCVETKKNENYKRDSSLLSYTVHRWIDSSYGWYGHYNRRNAKSGFYKPHIGCIFYDTTMLKLTAFVYVEYNIDYVDTLNWNYSDKISHFYDSHTVMGFRNSLESTWNFYELNEIFLGLGSRSLKRAEDMHSAIFLNKKYLQDSAFIAINKINGGHRLEAVKYCPCEEDFFYKSPLWEKGSRFPGHYLFETYQNTTSESTRPLRPWLNIQYPDSLTKLYQ